MPNDKKSTDKKKKEEKKDDRPKGGGSIPSPSRNLLPDPNPYVIIPCRCGGKHPANYRCPKVYGKK